MIIPLRGPHEVPRDDILVIRQQMAAKPYKFGIRLSHQRGRFFNGKQNKILHFQSDIKAACKRWDYR